MSDKGSITLLALETSCDETGVAVLRQVGDSIRVLASEIASQVDVHKLTGGVVPEVAAREHVSVLRPLIEKVIINSDIKPAELTAIAVTVGPGLVPALSIGITAAQTLAFAWQKPIIPVHHLEGHIYSALLAKDYSLKTNPFPALALIVSGGHTMLVKMTGHLQYEILGSTRDDAVGEAFDKVARLLGLAYPGGPALSELAEQGNPKAFNFSRPMTGAPPSGASPEARRSWDLDFSFSGIKTEVLYTLRDMDPPSLKLRRASVAASFQQAVVETLVKKTKNAAISGNPSLLLLSGGVAANQLLRQQMQSMAGELNIPIRIAPLEMCGDNAVMIGQAALFAHKKKRTSTWRDIDAHARLNLQQYSANSASPDPSL
ncbi:MAG: tRNA (adenosine(37)-N6)-threonylcarbamoyltransferase complex transferase subunit TsaD [bacterium]